MIMVIGIDLMLSALDKDSAQVDNQTLDSISTPDNSWQFQLGSEPTVKWFEAK